MSEFLAGLYVAAGLATGVWAWFHPNIRASGRWIALLGAVGWPLFLLGAGIAKVSDTQGDKG